jgi:KipI family sensor histidine kinase inhibitor
MTPVDLNADLGEGVSGDAGLDPAELDDLLLTVVTSANVACGGHAGDDASMARVCRLAVERGVAVGAQVSYVDRAGFGRTRVDVDGVTLREQLLAQLEALRTHAVAAGGRVAYLKPHGALYNAAVADADVADAVIDALLADAHRTGTALPVLTLPGGALAGLAAVRGIPVVAEAFAGRPPRPPVAARGGHRRRSSGRRTSRPPRHLGPRGEHRGCGRRGRRALRVPPLGHAWRGAHCGPDTWGARGRGHRRACVRRAAMTVVRRCGDRALLLDVDDVAGMALALRAAPLRGVVDVVPGATTVLVTHTADTDVAWLTQTLLSVEPREVEPGQVVTVEIPVVYDGADLDDVAAATGLSVGEVVERHTTADYSVAFCGFAPGFAYLDGLPHELLVPRLDSPRVRVPAGSVAIADRWAAVYPRESPGGWRLLGHTDLVLWDLARPRPALLVPGTRVRFQEVRT